ncbi:flagellar filament capping protein FliD [Paenibacillus sp. CMAA1364]
MVTRISGLASGMDIDAMVKKLMKAESIPLDKMTAQKQLMEWKRESYRETSTKMVSFLQDKLAKLSLSSSINAQKATVTGNTSAVSAVASSSASGSLDIQVTSLATASRAVSKDWTTKSPTIKSDFADWVVERTKDGVPIGTPKDDKVKVGNVDIQIDVGETIESFVNKINANTQTGVTAIYDEKSGLSLTSKVTGVSNIKVDLNISDMFGLSITSGTDAVLNVNGLAVSKSTNTFDINGVTLTLKGVTPPGESTNIEVSKDTDKLVENVQDFVNAYNEVLGAMNSSVNEERYKKYTPLTTEQKGDMSDEEIKLWTSKAKSGMLKNDTILQNTVIEMRNAMMQGVDIGRIGSDGKNQPLMLSELGITTGTYDTRGKLILDTDKLKTALNSDPEILNNFFGNQDKDKLLSNEYTEKDGIIAKLRKISNVSLQRMAETAGTSRVSSDITSTFINSSTMGEQLSSLDRRIADMTSRLTRIETNYFKKFTGMETAINKFNSTSSVLSSFMS